MLISELWRTYFALLVWVKRYQTLSLESDSEIVVFLVNNERPSTHFCFLIVSFINRLMMKDRYITFLIFICKQTQ